MFRRNHILLILLVILSGSLPFIWAAGLWLPDWSFSGFINNPIDGASYLAKMQEGWAGRWEFTLLYSAQAPEGTYLFLFYIFLGHLARILGVSLVWMFHAARLLASIGLIFTLVHFFARLFPGQPRRADWALWLCALGSGSGWLLTLATGNPSTDMLVAEGYPFLSMFTNPHFPLGLALILWMALIEVKQWMSPRGLLLAMLGLVLAIVQPFGLVIAALVLAARVACTGWFEKRFEPWALIWGLSLGGPFLLFQLIAIQSDPILAAWNQQNLTPSPEFWDLIISLTPAVLISLVGIYAILKQRKTPLWGAVCAWLIAGILLSYLPFSLQRRFLSGIFIPVAALCAVGLDWLSAKKKMRFLSPAIFSLSLLTNVFFLLLMSVGLVTAADPGSTAPSATDNYLPADVKDTLVWLRDNSPEDSVVLADAHTGQFVPAWSGRRTVYGHPFETPDTQAEKKLVNDFYDGKMNDAERAAYISERGIDYILWRSDIPPFDIDGEVVQSRGNTVVFEVRP